MNLRLNQIRANPWNANFMDPQDQEALKQCMHQTGPEKTLPIVVRLMADGGYELVDGEHRWAIAKELGWTKISVIIREADDLQAKAFCVSYNKLRGRFDWFKLHDVIKSDQDNGVNLEETYKGALSSKELKWILSLSDLVPQARTTLEKSLKKYPEYTLEQLHLMSKFPPDQQESLSETYQKPIATHLLTRLLTAFLQKNQPHPIKKEEHPYPPNNPQNQDEEGTPLDLWQSKWSNNNDDGTGETEDLFSQTDSQQDKEQTSKTDIRDKPRAWLLSVEHTCKCGRIHQVNFKKKTVTAQKENLLFEHVDFNTYTFLVHCDKCDNDHEVKINNTENDDNKEDVELVLCSRCDPVRKGSINVHTGEITWF
ncbi:MAG: ParB/RepB/Spo0J family partition protein [Candidatus Bathyarchaeota archaeon]|nr:ParB/RepB/Spo0J family partition protein [Candidatus Termitimicrobium sp.]